MSTLFRNILIVISLSGYQLFAQEQKNEEPPPQLSVLTSKYVDFMSTNVNTFQGTTIFDGTFIVLGEGIYGHFDLVAYDGSGKEIQKTRTGDCAYQSDHGSKIKAVSISISGNVPVAKVAVSFHEMRVEPNSGACIAE